MIEARSTDRGSTIGTIRGIAKSKNLMTIKVSKSLPANSEINNQTVCRMKIKNRITKTEENVIQNDFNKYRSIIFTETSLIC